MDKKTKKLIQALKDKREAKGLSIRALSKIIGVSFSSLARIERGEGAPDNNSKMRILEWLGDDARSSGLSFEDVAFVHFRAKKNAASKTIQCLLEAADILKKKYLDEIEDFSDLLPDESFSSTEQSVSLSKLEMEAMAEKFRSELGLKESDPLNSLNIKISGVEVLVPNQINGFKKACLSYLKGEGSRDWSAMSVPLDAKNDKWVILRNDQHTLERQRVTFLEECWHIFLGHKLTKIAKVSNAYGRTYDSSEEHDAFYLASACLLPEKAVTKSVKEGKSAEEIATLYGASSELVEYRIKRLGLWREYTGRKVELAEEVKAI